MDFIRPLVRVMMARDPSLRPDAAAALEQWREILGNMRFLHRYWRLRDRAETRRGSVVSDAVFLVKLGISLVRRSFR